MNTKLCKKCNKTKSIRHFSTRNSGKYLRTNCKKCDAQIHRVWISKNPDKIKLQNRISGYRRRGINITIDEYERLEKLQDKKCLICRIPANEHNKVTDKLFVDHDHKTGMIRGLLCVRCNSGIGLFDDNVKLMRKAIDYLLKFERIQQSFSAPAN